MVPYEALYHTLPVHGNPLAANEEVPGYHGGFAALSQRRGRLHQLRQRQQWQFGYARLR